MPTTKEIIERVAAQTAARMVDAPTTGVQTAHYYKPITDTHGETCEICGYTNSRFHLDPPVPTTGVHTATPHRKLSYKRCYRNHAEGYLRREWSDDIGSEHSEVNTITLTPNASATQEKLDEYAALIIRAVNSHEKLVAALRNIYEMNNDSRKEWVIEAKKIARAALRDAEAEK